MLMIKGKKKKERLRASILKEIVYNNILHLN